VKRGFLFTYCGRARFRMSIQARHWSYGVERVLSRMIGGSGLDNGGVKLPALDLY